MVSVQGAQLEVKRSAGNICLSFVQADTQDKICSNSTGGSKRIACDNAKLFANGTWVCNTT